MSSTVSAVPSPQRIGVIGAGLVGLALAHKLQLLAPGAEVTVIDKEPAVGRHQSGHNSGVVHAGLYYPPGSLKARLCLDGRAQLQEFCSEHGIAYEACGKLVIAATRSELDALAEIERRSLANGVPGLRRIEGSAIADLEPHAVGVAALHSPATAIVDYPAVARQLAASVTAAGGRLVLGYPVGAIAPGPGGTVVVSAAPASTRHWRARAGDAPAVPAGGRRWRAQAGTAQAGPPGLGPAGASAAPAGPPGLGPAGAGAAQAGPPGLDPSGAGDGDLARPPMTFDRVAICAGLHADRLARMAGDSAGPAIVPFRGDYRLLVPGRRHLVKGLIYPVPDPRYPFLGVHFTRRVDGTVDIGPNAVLAFAREGYRARDVALADLRELLSWPGFAPMARRHWRTGLGEMARAATDRGFIAAARRFVPELRPADVEPGESGVRAQALDVDGTLVDDFRIGRVGPVTAVRNAPSPAATSCLAIADHLAAGVLGAEP